MKGGLTMAEYVGRDAAIKAVKHAWAKGLEPSQYIEALPAADVAPVVHARWIQVDATKCRCSHCDIIALIALYPHGDKNFCPNCGAMMDGGADHDA